MLEYLQATKELNLKEAKLTKPAFELLGENLGDYLHMIEGEVLKIPYSNPHASHIRQLLDVYAEHFDNLISEHANSMNKSVKKLVTSLIGDLSREVE